MLATRQQKELGVDILAHAAGGTTVVLEFVEERLAELSMVNACTALHRIAKQTGIGGSTLCNPRLRCLVRHVSALVLDGERSCSVGSARSISNFAWSLARLEYADVPLFNAIAAAASPTIAAFGTQELSNTSWSFAPLALLHIPLMSSLSASALKRLPLFTPQDLSNMLWA